MKLTNEICRTAKVSEKRQKLSDGGGLQLWIQPTGSRHWYLIYQYRKVQKQVALGPYPVVLLSEARKMRLQAQRRHLGYDPSVMTPHGFRATACSLLNESGLWNPDAIERQLAHIESNNVRRVYARGTYWNERVRMMVWWADYLDTLLTGQREGFMSAPGAHLRLVYDSV